MVQFCFNRDHLSLIAGMHLSGVCFRLHEGAVKKEQVVEFLKALKAQFRQPLLILWDGASRTTADMCASMSPARKGRSTSTSCRHTALN